MSDRMRRVNSILKVAIAAEVEELKDPRLGFVTVTSVQASPDLRSAIVYYSVLGSQEERVATETALRKAAGRITSRVGSQITMKYTPRLEFRFDDTAERSERITSLLRDLDTEEG